MFKRSGAVLALLLALTACGAERPDRRTGPAEVAKVTWGLDSGPRALDPARAYDGKSALIYQQVYDSLLYLDGAGRLVPGLALSWSQPDRLTYVYKLRTDAVFWDGKPVTAQDAAFSLERHTDDAVASEFGAYFGAVRSVKATSADTVTVKLSRPDPFFRYVPALAGQVLQRSFVGANPKGFGTAQVGTMGSGPYKVESFSPATGATLVRNDRWWGAKPQVARLEFKVVSDPETLRLAVQSGDIDGTFLSDPSLSRRWRGLRSATVTWGPSPQSVYLSFDVTSPPFDDARVRRAIAMSVDRGNLARALFDGHARVAASITAPDIWSGLAPEQAGADQVRSLYDGLPGLPFDATKAAAELAASKHPKGFAVSVPYPASMKWLGDVLQNTAQNLKPLGVELTPRQVPFQEYIGRLYGKEKLGLQIIPYTPDYPDPAAIPSLVLGGGAFNTARFTTPELERLLAAQSTAKPGERVEGLQKILTTLADEMPYAPLFHPDLGLALNNRLALPDGTSVWLNFSQQWATRLRAAD
ncbi:hypothetical protein DP939_15895 [Spongiactinospora rosea]|uniref:Solute-binding protein family 5 domain-containing protein n=1 Tax=Spongiactinospora rosea TaxID=2248750 RepID=A0A366LZI9_9ACTN|nr:ABC transporter substrate-binding protein [Spongiactinospora rosea]RBQ19398.1 hypothetical protein DP939_15895 [Spongiactinospora rosea]